MAENEGERKKMIRKIVVADIGWCVARLSLDSDPMCNGLIIVSPAVAEEVSAEFYRPAESVHVWQQSNIEKLRDFLNEHFPKVP